MIETPHIAQTEAQHIATIHLTVARPDPANWRTQLNRPLK